MAPARRWIGRCVGVGTVGVGGGGRVGEAVGAGVGALVGEFLRKRTLLVRLCVRFLGGGVGKGVAISTIAEALPSFKPKLVFA